MPDELVRRAEARRAIDSGTLPTRPPDRIFGGPGSGELCGVCAKSITRAEMEYEVEFAGHDEMRQPDVFHFHLRCFTAWEMERTSPGTALRVVP